MATLSLAIDNSAPEHSFKNLTSKEAIKLRAKHLTDETWVVDMSGSTPVLLQARSNRTSSLMYLKSSFEKWRIENRINVEMSLGENYGTFKNNLPDRLLERITQVHGSSFRPQEGKLTFRDSYGTELANIYYPFRPPRPVDMTPPDILLEMLERVFPIESERKWMLQYCASVVNNPMVRPQCSALITGEGGTGKSLLIEMTKKALGGRHVNADATYADIEDKHSEILPNNLVVAFQDKVPTKNTYTNLKNRQTCLETTVNVKNNQRPVPRDVYARLFFTTNERRLFKIKSLSDGRRMFAPQFVKHKTDEKESKVFFKQFMDEFMNRLGTPALLYHWLLEMDMDGFDYTGCEPTPTLLSMIEMSESMLTKGIKEFLVGSPMFHLNQLLGHLRKFGVVNAPPDLVSQKLHAENYELTQRRIEAQSNRRIYFYQPKSNQRARSLPKMSAPPF